MCTAVMSMDGVNPLTYVERHIVRSTRVLHGQRRQTATAWHARTPTTTRPCSATIPNTDGCVRIVALVIVSAPIVSHVSASIVSCLYPSLCLVCVLWLIIHVYNPRPRVCLESLLSVLFLKPFV